MRGEWSELCGAGVGEKRRDPLPDPLSSPYGVLLLHLQLCPGGVSLDVPCVAWVLLLRQLSTCPYAAYHKIHLYPRWSYINVPCALGSISGLSLLFHWAVHSYSVFITKAL